MHGIDELMRRSPARVPSSIEPGKRESRPGLDDKIITAWNGMMISAMAEAGRC